MRLAGGALDWVLLRLGVMTVSSGSAEPTLENGVLTAHLFGVLLVVAALAVWWALFRAAWLLRAGVDWRSVCRTLRRPPARGQRAWQVATLLLWAGFGFVSLLAALLFANTPDELTWQLLTRSRLPRCCR